MEVYGMKVIGGRKQLSANIQMAKQLDKEGKKLNSV